MQTALVGDTQLLVAQALAGAVEQLGLKARVHTSAKALLEAHRSVGAELVLVSLRGGDPAWVEALHDLRRTSPRTRVLCLVRGDDTAQDAAARAAGAAWVLTDSSPLAEVLAAANPRQARPPREPDLRHRPDPSHLRFLTPRERQVLGHLSAARSTDDIAANLGLQRSTVRGYIQGILDKLGVHSRLEAVAYAAQAEAVGR